MLQVWKSNQPIDSATMNYRVEDLTNIEEDGPQDHEDRPENNLGN